ncbi:Man1-Src1p-C-terminal domain-containing protein [Lentinula aciculospora]|uniref:Man1-Src1p-C-terminal domain-containing protein n=1 Tax=Lentinula aciculospora TaxID=153920 RepID=A0A9W9ASA2_9AGAR|nr:Man1-Src1p-C-terminal domain-containing protein [Lentinula aciculospora]
MSRLTAAQIIAQGDYLEPDFQPTTLTISQLLGVLGYHSIVYPTPYSKAKLVQIFNDEVKRRAAKFKKERIKKENSIASDDGIKDGITGQYLSGPPVIRRSSRRLSRAPPNIDGEEESPPRPDPPKRRRSSAQPRLGGGPSRKPPPPVQPAVFEESEPEEQEQEPIRKFKRTKKSTGTSGTQSRRVSQADDSGWEDNNIFQSGAESSSPLRPSPVRSKGRRSSVAPRKSRKSMSAPPNVSPSSSPSKPPRVANFSPPQSNFEPEIPNFDSSRFNSPPARASSQWNFVSKPYTPPRSSKHQETKYKDVEVPLRDEDEPQPSYPEPVLVESVAEFDEATDDIPEINQEVEALHDADEHNTAIQQRIADAGTIAKLPREALFIEDSKPMSMARRLLFVVLFGILSYFTYKFKEESAFIGYCDTGSNTNRVLEELKSTRSLIAECNNENRTTLHDPALVADSPPCPIVPFPLYPESCTPCPEHAVCSGHTIACEKAYTLKSPFLLSFLPPRANPSKTTLSTSVSPSDMAWKVISMGLDGLPGFGSIAFPPICVEDPRRKRHIGALGKGIEALLGQHRGSLLCNAEADQSIKDEEGGEARRWGIQIHKLKETMREGADPQHVLPNFDDLFNEAVQQLVQWGGVLISEDAQGERYLAHKTPSLSLTCKLTVKSRDTWNEWRGTVVALATISFFVYASSSRRAKKRVESKRIAGLVQIALDALQQQELSHYTDPVSTPQPFLSSIQLRDLVLLEEHSAQVRQKVWEKVEKIVEGNANVRANMEEVYGGDELRVWRWVGSTAGSIDAGRNIFKHSEDSPGLNSPSSSHGDME